MRIVDLVAPVMIFFAIFGAGMLLGARLWSRRARHQSYETMAEELPRYFNAEAFTSDRPVTPPMVEKAQGLFVDVETHESRLRTQIWRIYMEARKNG